MTYKAIYYILKNVWLNIDNVIRKDKYIKKCSGILINFDLRIRRVSNHLGGFYGVFVKVSSQYKLQKQLLELLPTLSKKRFC